MQRNVAGGHEDEVAMTQIRYVTNNRHYAVQRGLMTKAIAASSDLHPTSHTNFHKNHKNQWSAAEQITRLQPELTLAGV